MEETTSRKRNREKGTEKALSVGDAGEDYRLAIPQVYFKAPKDVEEGRRKGARGEKGGAKIGRGRKVVFGLCTDIQRGDCRKGRSEE